MIESMMTAGRKAIAEVGLKLSETEADTLAFRVYAAMTSARLVGDGSYVPVRRVFG